MLVTLVYASSATKEFDDAEIGRLLEGAKRSNEANGITGVLYYQDGSFIQALEGEAAAVDATFERIRRDVRHGSIIVLHRGPIEARGFSFWSMGYPKADRDVGFDLQIAALRELVEKDAGAIVRTLLASFLKISSAQAARAADIACAATRRIAG